MYPISGCLQIMLEEQHTASNKQQLAFVSNVLKIQKQILGKRFS